MILHSDIIYDTPYSCSGVSAGRSHPTTDRRIVGSPMSDMPVDNVIIILRRCLSEVGLRERLGHIRAMHCLRGLFSSDVRDRSLITGTGEASKWVNCRSSKHFTSPPPLKSR